MKKAKLFILSIALMFIGIIGVNAEEITVCSSGCTYDSIASVIDRTDLNGKTVKMTENMKISTSASLIKSSINFDLGGNTLVLEDTVLAMRGVDVTFDNGTIVMENEGSLYLLGFPDESSEKTHLLMGKNLTISADETAIAIIPNGTDLSVYNTTLDVKGEIISGSFAITIHGDQKAVSSKAPVVNIYDTASLRSTGSAAIYGAGYGFWNINGGTIEGEEALSIKSGEYTITGGKFSATGEYIENPVSKPNGNEPTGAVISITANNGYPGHVKMNISGGEFTSKNGNAIYEGQTNSNSTVVDEIKISDGKFISAEGKATVRVTSTSDKLEGFIAGGEYSEDPKEELIVQNKVTKQLPNGNYVIGEERNIKVADTKNGKVTVDKSKAVKGEIIKLTITPDKGYELDKIIVKGLQDQKEITGTEFEMIDEDIEFVVTFKKVSTSVKNPNTGDNIMMILSIAFISLAGIIAASKKLKSNC